MTQAEQKSEPATVGTEAEPVAPAVKAAALKEYRDRERFEHALINRRLTWLLTSQTLLFAAYGLASQEHLRIFLNTTALMGMLIALLILVGVVCAIAAKINLWKRIRVQIGDPKFPLGVRTGITFTAFAPDVFMPLIFAAAWMWIFCHSPAA